MRPRVSGRVAGTRRLMDGVFHLDRLLRRGACLSLHDLSTEIEAHPRTVQRYLDILRDRWHAEVIFDRDQGGYRYADQGLAVPTTQLSHDDLLALCVAEPILSQYRGTPLGQEFTRAFSKLTDPLPPRVRADLEPAARRISVKATIPSHADVDRFRALMNATLQNRRLKITYFAAHRGATSVRTVDPYALRCVDGQWYLLAYCHERKAVVPFHVSRIWSVGEDSQTFTLPADFDPDQFASQALGIFRSSFADDAGDAEVRLRFDPFAARYVKELQLHPSQVLEAEENGGLLLRLTLGNFIELERYILGWGEHVEVLEPPALKARIRERLAAALGRYADSEAPAGGRRNRQGGRGGRHNLSSSSAKVEGR